MPPHVKINGVSYRLAEDAEGQHYSVSAEPLRPPNAVTVQGENSQKFQMRPDTLVWSLTDWSGGEGQIKYDNSKPNRWRELTGVRAFIKPGTVQPGYYVEDTQDSTGAADFTKHGQLVKSGGKLYLLDRDSATIYEWLNTNRWDAGTSLTGVTNGVGNPADGDSNKVFWIENATNNVWSKTSGGAPSKISDTLISTSGTSLIALGSDVYVYYPFGGKVWRISKGGSSEELFDDFSDDGAVTSFSSRNMATLGGKLYVVIERLDETVIRELTPTTAAGTGYGAEIARIKGLRSRSIWSHAGRLFIFGVEASAKQRAAIFYLTPGGEYGTIGRLREENNFYEGIASYQNGQLLDHYLLTDEPEQRLYQIDAVSGGMAVLALNEDGDANDPEFGISSMIVHQGNIFWAANDQTTDRVMRAVPHSYTKNSEVISPWNDFSLADEKILASLVLSCEDLPADWTVTVDYATDGDDTWTNAITYTTDNGNGTKVAVSTNASTVKFRSVSIRIGMSYTGSGVPGSAPEILGVDVMAMVAKPTKVVRLLLDLSDDGSLEGGFSGTQKRTTLETATNTQAVVSFEDYYRSYEPGDSVSFDAIIDDYSILLSQPGEGVAAVTLKEVA